MYIYIIQNEIPVTVSFADIQYHSYESFSFKSDVVLVTKYISYKFLHHSILTSSSKLITYILLRVGLFAIKAACYIIGTTNQKGIYLHLLLKIKINWPESKYLRKFLAIHNIPACNKSATSPCHRIDHVLYSWKKR